jgi:pimeloyl-ACP methyl ester carboxylesterase
MKLWARPRSRGVERRVFVVLGVVLAALGGLPDASGQPSRSPAAGPTGIVAAADPIERYASLEGTRIAYEQAGEGPEALVFVHGWSCDRTFFRRQVEAFRLSTRVVALDLPGHGRSDKPETKYSIDLFARSVDAVLRDAGIGRAVIVGHSMGAPIVRQFARLFPEKVLGLVIVDGMLRLPVNDPDQVEKLIAPLRAPDYQDAVARMVEGMLIPRTPDDVRRIVRETMLGTPQHVIVSAMEEMFFPGVWKNDPITLPLLVVLARSPAWAPDTEAFIRTLAPKAEIYMMDDASHFIMLERPWEFNAYLSDFLLNNRLLGRR